MEEQNNLASAEVEVKQEEKLTEEVKPTGFRPFFEKNFLAFSILFSAVLISGSLFYTSGSKTQAGIVPVQDDKGQVKAEVSVDDDPVLGNKDAKLTIIEFSDFQCPFCRVFWKDTYKQIKKEYIDTGKVKLVYRDYPLDFHPMAGPSAQAAECADDQGKFWEMHDKIFMEQDKLGQGTVTYAASDLKKWASQIGLNASQFNQCLDSGKYKSEVEKDLADGSASGISGTPSFVINGRLMVGAQPFSAFKAVIDEELKKK